VLNVLAERYASAAVRDVWSRRGKVLLERDFWIAVMKAQRDLGVPIPSEAIRDYERVKAKIDLESIAKRERVTLHDVKSRIEEFSELAQRQFIHLGLTSRDLTENVEQLQIFRSLKIVQRKVASALLALSRRAEEFRDLMITGRTHNVPAQPTTLGKRIAMFGQEMLLALDRLDHLIESYPVRGLKGAVGTQLDQLTLLGGRADKVAELESRVLKHLGIPASLRCVGQVYPRGLDFDVVSALHQTGSAAASFATTMRLMAGAGLVTEGFQEGQVGSSAMPHKANARNCERICGFSTVLSGYVAMTASMAGDQWNEGDVSCSVVRRVALPDAFFAIDGSLETLLTVLVQMEPFPSAIALENDPHGGRQARGRARDGARGHQGAFACCREGHAIGDARAGPAGPARGRPAHRPLQEGPSGNPCGQRAVRGVSPQPGRRLRGRGCPALEAVQGRGRVQARAPSLGRREAFSEIFVCLTHG
jgi:adenylosuccinate lyase